MLLPVHAHKQGTEGNRIVLQHDSDYSLINNPITILGTENMEAGKKNFLYRTLPPQNIFTVP